MLSIKEKLKSQRVYFDGGFGTMLQSMGLSQGNTPESWNLSNPDKIISLHKAYLEAGSDVITANTFGINCQKYSNYREMISKAMDCAKKAVSGFEGRYIAFDIGPTGRLMEPMGDLGFEEAVQIYSENVKAAAGEGADLIIIETMNDCLETKAAVIAAKECSDLPIFVTNAYDKSGKLMTGADPFAMISMLEGLGVDALGMNCSFGPDVMLEVIDEFSKYSSLPIIVQPNAGLPAVIDGKTVYTISADEFSDYMLKLSEHGVTVLGGCCGTTPEYIKKTIEKTASLPFSLPAKKQISAVSSYTHAVEISGEPILIGERINPTGKPRLKEALRSNDMNYILNEAIKQADLGVQILDVNVGLPEIDEAAVMKKAVLAIQSVTDLPLQLDSSNPKAIECAMRVYAGKPLINSVNGEEKSMKSIFPLVKKYGGAVIALTMDKNGIPQSAQGRLEIAKRIVAAAAEYGISKENIIVDPLCLTISSGKDNALITLEAVRLIHESGLKTSLGVSNVSFGLPQREKINSAFFALALEHGLDLAIMNPHSKGMMDVYHSFKALHGMDEGCIEYINYASSEDASEGKSRSESAKTLISAIVSGLKEDAACLCRDMLKTVSPIDIINSHIIPALNEVGIKFEKKQAYLPQLLMSADSATAAFEEVKKAIPAELKGNERRFIIATVKGDIHDIGKNIVRVMLESYGFKVYDLGRDVAAEIVLECVKKTGCKLVGLSALMTTTVPSMEYTIKLLKEYDPSITTVVGGAVLNQEYADMIGADFYAKDAMDTVRYAEEFYSVSDRNNLS